VLNFFTEKDGFLHHERLDAEIRRARERQASASDKAKKAAAARWGKDTAHEDASSMEQGDASSNASYNHNHLTNIPNQGENCTWGRELSSGEVA